MAFPVVFMPPLGAMKYAACLALLLSLAASATAQPSTIYDQSLSERRVSYTMDVTLDPATHTVRGHERVAWRNPDRVPVDTLQFHLYLNAFRPGSTFMRESGGRHRGFTAQGADPWGGLEIDRMRVAVPDGAIPSPAYRTDDPDLTGRIRFIQPDDDNPDDRTVAAVALPQAVQPGQTIYLDVDFTATLPQIFARTGWQEKEDGTPFFMVAQWFPKLGVYEIPGQRYVPADAPRGRWNTHQFHANSEFYADFGTYDVTITTPSEYVVGASGVRTGEKTEGGVQTLTYRADDVHDFAWTASPAFRVFTDAWRHVNLRLLLQPEHAAQAQRHFAAVKAALERFDAWVGAYPYTTLTLVDGLGGSAGMEYPTLITGFTYYNMPAWLRIPEGVLIHELGHQYFYGILASNEFEEAWLDEGINSYLEVRIMDDAYGAGSWLDLPGLRVSNEAYQRYQYARRASTRAPVFRRSWEYAYSGDYAVNAYAKPAMLLLALERYLGWETMRAILQAYYDRWRFRHPTTRAFIDVAREVSGQDLDWFFDQFVYGTVAVDYAVDRVTSERIGDDAEDAGGPQWYRSRVDVARSAEGFFPLTLRVRFADGHVEDVAWDGRDEEKTFLFERPARLVEAYLDPANVVTLDLNRLNNRRVVEPQGLLGRKVQLKVAVWLQQLFYLLAGLL